MIFVTSVKFEGSTEHSNPLVSYHHSGQVQGRNVFGNRVHCGSRFLILYRRHCGRRWFEASLQCAEDAEVDAVLDMFGGAVVV